MVVRGQASLRYSICDARLKDGGSKGRLVGLSQRLHQHYARRLTLLRETTHPRLVTRLVVLHPEAWKLRAACLQQHPRINEVAHLFFLSKYHRYRL